MKSFLVAFVVVMVLLTIHVSGVERQKHEIEEQKLQLERLKFIHGACSSREGSIVGNTLKCE